MATNKKYIGPTDRPTLLFPKRPGRKIRGVVSAEEWAKDPDDGIEKMLIEYKSIKFYDKP